MIEYIKSLGNNESLSLTYLSQKGFQKLWLIRRFLPEGVVLELPDLFKKSRLQRGFKKSFHASSPENPILCIVNCVREYEKRTK